MNAPGRFFTIEDHSGRILAVLFSPKIGLEEALAHALALAEDSEPGLDYGDTEVYEYDSLDKLAEFGHHGTKVGGIGQSMDGYYHYEGAEHPRWR